MYERIEEIIASLKEMASGAKLPFTISVDDPAGNSWIEPSTSDKHGKYARHDYNRSTEQNAALGLGGSTEEPENVQMRPEYHPQQMHPQMPQDSTTLDQDAPQTTNSEDDIIENQVYSFPATCPGCTKPCATNMKMVNIPHFKQVVLMSTVCDHCGYRSNEVKTGGEIPEKGRKITINIETKEDLSRDILKSESCAMSCPELDLSVEPGTLGGRFTTIEGLLTQVREDLHSSIFDAADSGDSMPTSDRGRWTAFFENLDHAIAGNFKFTIVLQDPLASSYVQSFTAPEPDPQIRAEEYERSEKEEEELGLRDIKVEGYEDDAGKQAELDEIEKAKKFLAKATGAVVDAEAELDAEKGETS
jgi:zinc finger protein